MFSVRLLPRVLFLHARRIRDYVSCQKVPEFSARHNAAANVAVIKVIAVKGGRRARRSRVRLQRSFTLPRFTRRSNYRPLGVSVVWHATEDTGMIPRHSRHSHTASVQLLTCIILNLYWNIRFKRLSVTTGANF